MTIETMPPGLGPLAVALAKAQSEFGPVTKDKTVTVQKKTGGSYSFKYAPLDQILSVVKGPLSANGLALVQLLDTEALVTMLIHESGASLEARTPLPSSGDVQAYGSAITYLRRYAVQAMLGIAAEDDDDGNRATGNLAEPEREVDDEPTVTLLGRDRVRGKLVVSPTNPLFQGQWREGPKGHAIGFRLKRPSKDGDIPQVLIGGDIGETLFAGSVELLDQQVTVQGHLYNVSQKGRTTYTRLVVGERPEDWIETSDLRIPPLRDPEQEVVDAVAPGQESFDLAESARIDAEAARAG